MCIFKIQSFKNNKDLLKPERLSAEWSNQTHQTLGRAWHVSSGLGSSPSDSSRFSGRKASWQGQSTASRSVRGSDAWPVDSSRVGRYPRPSPDGKDLRGPGVKRPQVHVLGNACLPKLLALICHGTGLPRVTEGTVGTRREGCQPAPLTAGWLLFQSHSSPAECSWTL